MWQEQGLRLMTNKYDARLFGSTIHSRRTNTILALLHSLGAFVSFGILYDLVAFSTDRYKCSALIMKYVETHKGVFHSIKHSVALAVDDLIESVIIVACTMPANVVLRRLEAQAGGTCSNDLNKV